MINRQSWTYDKVACKSYNIMGAFECALMNLGIVKYDGQWDIEDMEGYVERIQIEDKIFDRYKGCKPPRMGSIDGKSVQFGEADSDYK